MTNTTDKASNKEFPPIQKDEVTQIRVTLKFYKNSEYVDIRQWWKPEDKEEYLPTKSGVTIPVSDTLELFEQICDIFAEIRDILGADNG